MLKNIFARTLLTASALVSLFGLVPAFAHADTLNVDFENPPYTFGTINAQDGWLKTGAYDSAVDSSFSTPNFGAQSLRISDAVTSGSFGDQTFSKSLTDEAGEAVAENGGMSGGVRQPHFEATFDLATVVKDLQPGMHVSVSPDRGDGARMSYLRFEDHSSSDLYTADTEIPGHAAGTAYDEGINVFFDDVTAGNTLNSDTFNETEIATLDRNTPHSIKFVMDFVPGPHNDIVKIYIDGILKATGTSWEDYYRFDSESNPSAPSDTSRTVDSLLFRTSGGSDPDNAGKGFLIDNLTLTSSGAACDASATQTIFSDSGTYDVTDAHPAVALSFVHPAWTASIPGAMWIWATNPVVTIPDTDVAKTFTHDFTIVGTPTGAELKIAADNSYTAWVNGHEISTDTTGATFGSLQDIPIPAAYLVTGTNTLTITVTNWGVGQSADPASNPAGLLYSLSVTNNECVTPSRTGSLTVTKVVVGNPNYTPADFPLFVDDTSVTSGASHSFPAGPHAIHESSNPDFTQSFSGDCALDADNLKRLDLVVDFQKKKAALQQALITSPLDALNPQREGQIADIDAKITALENAIQATITLGVDQSAECTITNTYVQPPAASCPADTHPVLVETTTVNSASTIPAQSLASLANGQAYLLTASGTWQNSSLNVADTEYASTDAWATHMDGYNIDPYFLGSGEFDLMVNGAFASWGAYNSGHSYTIQYTGTGAPAAFMVFDGDSTVPSPTPNAPWYGDNSGNLSVAISKCVSNFGSLKIVKNTVGGDGTFTFSGAGDATITTANGMGDVTINGLTPGSFTVTEAAKAGWNQTSSTCADVTVTAGETATCTVVNTKQASISGMKYNDLNRNGKKDANEPGLQGWKIRLYVQGVNGSYTLLTTATTDANGNYTFSNVAPGKYKIREVNQKGWKRMSKNPKPIVVVAGADTSGVNFGNAQKKQQEREDSDDDSIHDDQGGQYNSRSGRSVYND